MACLRTMLFYAAAFFVVQIAASFQQDHGVERDASIYDGMTDREIIVGLIEQNDYLVKAVKNLENWNFRQQQDIDILQTTVRKQQRQLRQIDRILTRRNQDDHHVQELSESTARHEHSNNAGPQEERKGGNHVIPKVGVQSGKRIVAKDGHSIRNGFEGRNRNTRQRETFNRVAFFATANTHITNLGGDQVLEFRNVVTNIGNAYSGSTGIFTAPFPGTYVFSTSLMGVSDGDHHYYVAKNHNAVSRLHIDSRNQYSTTTHTVILDLKQGDDVEVRRDDLGRDIAGNNYTCFSGFLLYDGESSGVIVG